MITEEEAKEKVCPFTFNRTYNGETGDGGVSCCLTDRCMAWKQSATTERGFCGLIPQVKP